MIRNFFLTTWRNMRSAKGHWFLAIAGLTVGLAASLLILLHVQYETRFDDYHRFGDRIFRIHRADRNADGSLEPGFCTLAPSFVPLLKGEFREIERIARLWGPGDTIVKAGSVSFTEERFFLAEPEIFDILSIPVLQGNPRRSLQEKGNVILSRSMAIKYFGRENPLGRLLSVRDTTTFQVAGIMDDTPANSHLHFDFLASYITLKGLYGSGDNDYFHGSRNFSDNVTLVYARLAAGVSGPQMQARIATFLDRRFGKLTTDQGRIVKFGDAAALQLAPVRDIHLRSHTRNEFELNGDSRMVVLFTLIALFILVIACINFVNLATARAIRRCKEVGMRKVLGAQRRQLAWQFLAETLLITLAALALAFVLTGVLLPAMRAFTGQDLSLEQAATGRGLITVLAIFLGVGLAAGLYPALYLSSFSPTVILKGERSRGKSRTALRRVLVVFQFAISIALIFCVTVIARQVRFVRNADLGFAPQNIVLFPADGKIVEHWEDVRGSLLSEGGIVAATLSKRAPSGRLLDSPGFAATVYGKKVQDTFSMPHNRVEHDFFKTYGMRFVAGRDFSRQIATDSAEAFILNETAVRQLGFRSAADAIGAPMEVRAPDVKGRIIGVVRDFNYESLRERILPMVSYVRLDNVNTLSLRIASGSLQRVAAHVQKVFDRYNPGTPVKYDFLDDRLAALYRNEERMMDMFQAFGLLAIVISCLGLFSLAAYSASLRIREMGVRKAFGATVANLFWLLSREFTQWVLVANLIAWPIAFWAMSRWLDNFAYRAHIGILPFLFSALLAFLVALATVSTQSLRAARANPVDSLRYE